MQPNTKLKIYASIFLTPLLVFDILNVAGIVIYAFYLPIFVKIIDAFILTQIRRPQTLTIHETCICYVYK